MRYNKLTKMFKRGCLCCILFPVLANAQNAPRYESPVIHTDGSVTFSLFAPQADSVSVSGDFIGLEANTLGMTKAANGLWSVTTPPLPAELYNYEFRIDGMTISDPSNILRQRNGDGWKSHVLVSKEKTDLGGLYSVQPDVPHGSVHKVWYDSPQLGTQRRMSIYVPAGYEKEKAYPVLYLLHGGGDDEDCWLERGKLAQIMDNLIAQGRIKPMIVVMPNANTGWSAANGEGSWRETKTHNAWAKLSMPQSFKDIQEYVEANYKTINRRSARAVCGMSWGGGHVFTLSIYYPDMFDYYGLFSSAPLVDGAPLSNERNFYENTIGNALLAKQVEALRDSHPHLYWICIGKKDGLVRRNADLRRYLDEHGMTYIYKETEGAHTWRNWRQYLIEFTQMIFKDI